MKRRRRLSPASTTSATPSPAAAPTTQPSFRYTTHCSQPPTLRAIQYTRSAKECNLLPSRPYLDNDQTERGPRQCHEIYRPQCTRNHQWLTLKRIVRNRLYVITSPPGGELSIVVSLHVCLSARISELHEIRWAC